MNFQYQIAKALNNPPFGLSKAASKYDSEALAEFNFRAKTATQTNTSAFRKTAKSIKTWSNSPIKRKPNNAEI